MVTQKEIYQNAVNHGFWNTIPNVPEKLCLIHSEVSEALEAIRIDDMDNFAEELADIVIRVMDLAEYMKINLEIEIEKKHAINLTRPSKHNKRF